MGKNRDRIKSLEFHVEQLQAEVSRDLGGPHQVGDLHREIDALKAYNARLNRMLQLLEDKIKDLDPWEVAQKVAQLEVNVEHIIREETAKYKITIDSLLQTQNDMSKQWSAFLPDWQAFYLGLQKQKFVDFERDLIAHHGGAKP